MAIWFLILWGWSIPPFESGQYQSQEQCREAARIQVAVFQRAYGKLSWKCEMRVG
jgi:hypothetical protein